MKLIGIFFAVLLLSACTVHYPKITCGTMRFPSQHEIQTRIEAGGYKVLDKGVETLDKSKEAIDKTKESINKSRDLAARTRSSL